MALEKFTKKKNEWNGKDFRGETIHPKYVAFIRQHPKVFEWAKDRPESTIANAAQALEGLSKFLGLTPEQFLELDKKAARDKAWEYLSSFKMQHPGKALVHRNSIQSFYYWHNEEKMPFIPRKHDIVYEPKKIKHRMSKDTCWQIIHKAKNLRNETILLFAFESGVRRNAIAHLNFGHYKNFLWFKKTEDGEIVNSNEREGNIAIFKVMAKPTKQFTHDNKLRGKGINWYYGCLHKEATKILKEYIAKYHQHSKADTPLWYSSNPLNRLNVKRFYDVIKSCIERAGLPTDQIDFHAFRRGFRSVVRNTVAITDNEFKEAIMGHKQKGSQEAYFDKDPLEFAREYAKCDFTEPFPEKDRALAKKDKEIERLKREQERYLDAIERAEGKATLKVYPASPELNKAFNEFNDVLEQREQYEKDMQAENTQNPGAGLDSPIKNVTNPTPILTTLEDDLLCCPDQDKYVQQSVECEKCKTENPKKHKDCYAERIKNPFNPIFKCSKPKPNFLVNGP